MYDKMTFWLSVFVLALYMAVGLAFPHRELFNFKGPYQMKVKHYLDKRIWTQANAPSFKHRLFFFLMHCKTKKPLNVLL